MGYQGPWVLSLCEKLLEVNTIELTLYYRMFKDLIFVPLFLVIIML